MKKVLFLIVATGLLFSCGIPHVKLEEISKVKSSFKKGKYDAVKKDLDSAEQRVVSYFNSLQNGGVDLTQKIDDQNISTLYKLLGDYYKKKNQYEMSMDYYKKTIAHEKTSTFEFLKTHVQKDGSKVEGYVYYPSKDSILNGKFVREIPVKKVNTPKITKLMNDFYVHLVTKGGEYYKAKKYLEARNNFVLSYEATQIMGKADTSLLYNAALCVTKLKNKVYAIQDYERLFSLKYTGVKTNYQVFSKVQNQMIGFGSEAELKRALKLDPNKKLYGRDTIFTSKSVRPNLIKQLSAMYINSNQLDKALTILKVGAEENPSDKDFILQQGSIYFKKGNERAFVKSMLSAIEKDPNNHTLYFNVGVVNYNLFDKKQKEVITKKEKVSKLKNKIRKLGRRRKNRSRKKKLQLELKQLQTELTNVKNIVNTYKEDAIKYYKKAIEIKNDYSDAYINLVVVILSEEKGINAEMSNLGFSQKDKMRYNFLNKKKNQMYKNAQSHLEKAIKFDSKNKQLLETLKNIYGALGNTKKYKEVKNKLNSL